MIQGGLVTVGPRCSALGLLWFWTQDAKLSSRRSDRGDVVYMCEMCDGGTGVRSTRPGWSSCEQVIRSKYDRIHLRRFGECLRVKTWSESFVMILQKVTRASTARKQRGREDMDGLIWVESRKLAQQGQTSVSGSVPAPTQALTSELAQARQGPALHHCGSVPADWS